MANKINGLTMAVTDMKGMINFYHQLFGIEFNQVNMFGATLFSGEWQGMNLLFCPAEIAGNTAKQNRHQYHVQVTHLDKAIELVKENGGRLMGEIEVEKGIRKIGIYDPDNNTLVLEESQ